MREGDKHSRRTDRFDSRELAELTRQPAPDQARNKAGSDGHAGGRPPRAGTARPVGSLALPRTTTLDDPLTTSLLAEVARRSRTIEISPAQVDEARNTEPSDLDPSSDPK